MLILIDFAELLNNCIERINGITIGSNIKIIRDNTKEIIKVYGDEEKLSRAVINVASNCIRYASSIVEIHMVKIDTSRINLTICDDGPGFDINDLPHIFDRFYKGKKGNFRLGLAISKNIIERHNGKITAENSPKGAIFTIELYTVNNC